LGMSTHVVEQIVDRAVSCLEQVFDPPSPVSHPIKTHQLFRQTRSDATRRFGTLRRSVSARLLREVEEISAVRARFRAHVTSTGAEFV
jgi:hypothetical protein